MAAPAPISTSIPKIKTRLVNDETCRVMCPECYPKYESQATSLGVVDDGTRYGCGRCGIVFSIEWEF